MSKALWSFGKNTFKQQAINKSSEILVPPYATLNDEIFGIKELNSGEDEYMRNLLAGKKKYGSNFFIDRFSPQLSKEEIAFFSTYPAVLKQQGNSVQNAYNNFIVQDYVNNHGYGMHKKKSY